MTEPKVAHMQLELPTEHYKTAIEHEAGMVCCLLIDRRMCRFATASPEDFVDLFWADVYRRLLSDHWMGLAELLKDTEEHSARTICDAMQDPFTGAPRVFLWNFDFHQSEVVRLRQVRREFLRAADFVLEHGDISWT